MGEVHLRLADGSYACRLDRRRGSFVASSVSVSTPAGLNRVTCGSCGRSRMGRAALRHMQALVRLDEVKNTSDAVYQVLEIINRNGSTSTRLLAEALPLLPADLAGMVADHLAAIQAAEQKNRDWLKATQERRR